MKATKVLGLFPCAVMGDDDVDGDGNTLQPVHAGKAWPANSESGLPSDSRATRGLTHLQKARCSGSLLVPL